MRRFFRSEAGATVLWVLSSLVLAAILVPWLYQAGKWLGTTAHQHELPATLEWLGAACERADFSRYFSRAMALAAVLLLPALLWRVREIERRNGQVKTLKTPVNWPRTALEISVGFVIAAGILWSAGTFFEAMGAFTPRPNALPLGKVFRKIFLASLTTSLIEEWLFRGLLLGLWLRFSKPFTACIGTSLVFAFVHFLKVPAGVLISEPSSLFAGFELLGKILIHFAEPRFFLTDFITLAAVGMILAWATLRTGKLWFSVGLHAGWILAYKGFNLLHRRSWDGPVHVWQIGGNLLSGLYPLVALVATAAICHLALKLLRPPGCI